MRKGSWLGTAALTLAVTATAWQLAGCQNFIRSLIPPIPVPITFVSPDGDGLEFAVTAGEPRERALPVELDPNSASQINQVRNATLEIGVENIAFAPADTGGDKGTAAFQDVDNTITVTAAIAASDQVDSVCETGEVYGPFVLTLDENNQPVAVTPSSVTLSANTLELIKSLSFAVCIVVESTIDGTVTVNGVLLRAGL